MLIGCGTELTDPGGAESQTITWPDGLLCSPRTPSSVHEGATACIDFGGLLATMEAMAELSKNQHLTLDREEVERFSRMSEEWWDPKGKFQPLHKLGPARMSIIRDAISGHYRRDPLASTPLSGLSMLDIGCGGGLVSEPLTRLGGQVSGIDPSDKNIEAARIHAAGQQLEINYRQASVEDLVKEGAEFDCVVCLEVVEHVPDVGKFVALCGCLVKPGGVMVLSTLNRTLKSFALAIVGAEYVLRWLPVGTHQWSRFVTPDELAQHVTAAGLVTGVREGIVYNPISDRWLRSADTDVNYLLTAVKPRSAGGDQRRKW